MKKNSAVSWRHVKFVLTGLLIAVFGGRSFALTGSGGYAAPYLACDHIQSLSDWTSNLVNPALMYRVNQLHLSAGGYKWGMNNFDASNLPLGFQQLVFLYPWRLDYTFGLTLIGTSASIEQTRINPVDQGQIIKGEDVRFGDLWLIGSFSYRVVPWLMLGTNVKTIFQNRFDSSQVGIGADLGLYFNPLDHYRYGDLGLSLNFQDIIPPGTLILKDSVQLSPSRLRLGVRYAVWNDKLIGDAEMVLEDAFAELYGIAKTAYENKKVQRPARYNFHLKYEFVHQIWLKGGWTNNNTPFLGFNFNWIIPLPEMINYLTVDYHLGYSVLDPDVGLTMMAKAGFDFWYTREQRESRRLYERLIVAPMDAYNEAMRLYLAGKYWQAAFAFGKVISLYPTFHLNDKASYYMGNCFRFLHLNSVARDIYKSALEEYSTSDMRPKYLYGLQSLDYREEKYEDALKNHAFIINLYPENDIRPDADYLAGQIYFIRKNYNAAEMLLSKIQPSEPVYIYAQYTMAIINVENKKIEAAEQNLKNILSDTAQDASALLLKDAANLKLGHLYYEKVDLRKAVEAYKRVPEGSRYGDEAMLGTAWSFIKVNQPSLCLQTVERLISSHPESPLICEAYLLKGYSLMLEKKYLASIQALEKCLELAKGRFITDADVQQRKINFAAYESQFRPTADNIKKNASRKPTEQSLKERSELELKYKEFAKANNELFEYILQGTMHRKFLRMKEKIIDDATYALAIAHKLAKTGEIQRELQKQQLKEDQIDKEIEKLQKELEKTE